MSLPEHYDELQRGPELTTYEEKLEARVKALEEWIRLFSHGMPAIKAWREIFEKESEK